MTKPGRPEREDEDTEDEVRVGWRMGGLGMEVAAQVAAGAVLGWLYDKWRGSAPTGLLVGGIAGIVVGLFSMIRGAMKLNQELERKHPTAGRGRPLVDDEDEEDEDNP